MFDECEVRVRRVVINAGRVIRELKGLPVERDVTVLYVETAPLVGIRVAGHGAHPAGIRLRVADGVDRGKVGAVVKDCPACGGKGTFELFDLCRKCKSFGKFRTKWVCSVCQHRVMSEKAVVQVLDEMGVEFKPGMKAEMGIMKIIDEVP